MDPKIKQKTLRMISNGMYIVTSRSGEQFGGATVTWRSQASFKPPLLMAAIRRVSNVFECMERSRVAAVHVLDAGQEDIARKFLAATKREGTLLNGEQFAEGKTSSPILAAAPAYMECTVRQIIDSGGDHALVVLEVVETGYRRDSRPLLIADTKWHYGG